MNRSIDEPEAKAAALKAAEQWLAAGEKDKAKKLKEDVGKESPKNEKANEMKKKAG